MAKKHGQLAVTVSRSVNGGDHLIFHFYPDHETALENGVPHAWVSTEDFRICFTQDEQKQSTRYPYINKENIEFVSSVTGIVATIKSKYL